ncbi:PQQ-dependent sugar dehydrogenase [Geodermatophilus sp. SYSU D00691]
MRGRSAGRAVRLLAATVVLTGALAACGDEGYQQDGPWRPLPEGAPPQVGPPTESAPPPAPGQPADPGSGQQAGDPNVVASDLDVPTGLVVLPDGTAIVGERETGRLLQVFPDRSPARELMTVSGIDTSGDGGLLGLALSPTFAEDGLLYAYVTTPTDNRVVRFPIGGTPNPVLAGIPRGATHNGGALLFGSDGTLYVGTGDTGDAALAQDPQTWAGKVLHIDVFGQPIGSDPVHARGLANVTALCLGADDTVFATDDPAAGPDELNAIAFGRDYGWPTEAPDTADPVTSFATAEAGPGGCSIAGSTVFLGMLEGEKVSIATLDENGAVVDDPEEFLAGTYGRLRTVVLDSQGGLWITTSNRDGVGTPRDGDDKVLRIIPPTSGGDSPL